MYEQKGKCVGSRCPATRPPAAHPSLPPTKESRDLMRFWGLGRGGGEMGGSPRRGVKEGYCEPDTESRTQITSLVSGSKHDLRA
jgi:hypothetical protein